jgi:hypothetical protein
MATFAINGVTTIAQPGNVTPIEYSQIGTRTDGAGIYNEVGKVIWERSSCDLTQLRSWTQYQQTVLTSLDTLVNGAIQRILGPTMGRVEYRIADPSGNSSMRFTNVRVEFWNLNP